MPCHCDSYIDPSTHIPRLLTAEDALVQCDGTSEGDIFVRIETNGERWAHGCNLGGGYRRNVAAFLPKDGQIDVWMRRSDR